MQGLLVLHVLGQLPGTVYENTPLAALQACQQLLVVLAVLLTQELFIRKGPIPNRILNQYN